MAFTQSAEGHFSFYGKPGTPHCGPKTSEFPTRIDCGYAVKMKYEDNALDSNGFLLDNTFFGGYFSDFAHCHIGFSCERLAKVIAEQLQQKSGAVTVEVTLNPVNGVEVSYVR